jgi:hypothetical protein
VQGARVSLGTPQTGCVADSVSRCAHAGQQRVSGQCTAGMCSLVTLEHWVLWLAVSTMHAACLMQHAAQGSVPSFCQLLRMSWRQVPGGRAGIHQLTCVTKLNMQAAKMKGPITKPTTEVESSAGWGNLRRVGSQARLLALAVSPLCVGGSADTAQQLANLPDASWWQRGPSSRIHRAVSGPGPGIAPGLTADSDVSRPGTHCPCMICRPAAVQASRTHPASCAPTGGL